MKKKYIVLSILLLTINSIFSRGIDEDKVPADFVKNIVENKFKTYSLDSKNARIVIDKYFKTTKYKVIYRAKADFGKRDYKVYFAVEEYKPEIIYQAIKRGIMVREDGFVLAYFEPEKGVYSTQRKILDFKRIGFEKGEVECFVLYFNDEGNEKEIINQIQVTLLDQEYHNIIREGAGCRSTLLYTILGNLSYNRERDEIFYDMAEDFELENKIYARYQKNYQSFRASKAKGNAVVSAAVKAEFERLKKIGMVKEKKVTQNR